MTLAYRRSESGTEHINWVSCPVCEATIDEQESFADHYESCPWNPEVEA